ncbi:hypothetical protein [Flavobacterium sp. HSC-61S13]|uniref:hypothetical protein n=1 Tax=Flavobacterium sp. HSC-61S13 TaxID=2910963 RepID=UPI00209F4522|nr:hypothetical protein [Flavobacterium sp. HSC-61S13]MCP1996665.1 hypothetical protein [Flavobacterium sp. HSC-61S13]
MATITLRASLPPPITPLSWGNNTIVTTSITSRFDDPHWTNWLGLYQFKKLDFTTDTFPQFKANVDSDLHSILITEIVLPANLRFRYGSNSDIQVGDIIDVGGYLDIMLDSKYSSFTDMTYGYFKYISSEDGLSFEPSVESIMNLIILPATDAFILQFLTNSILQFPKGRISSILMSDISSNFNYYSDPNTQGWQANTAGYNFLNQYILDIGNTNPYKLEIWSSNPDSRITFLGSPVVKHQKIPIGLIQSGYLKVDFSENNSAIRLELRFGDAYTGSFRLNPF